MSKLIEDFKALRNICTDIRSNYNTYLYLGLEETSVLLSKVAPAFFAELSEILRRDWLLQVCKLMDVSSTRRKEGILENISINLIVDGLDARGLCTENIRNTAFRLGAYGKKLNVARDKLLAHNDRSHYFLGRPLGDTSEEELNQFIFDLQFFCDSVGTALGEGPLDFSVSACKGDVVDFVLFLRKAVSLGI